MPPARPRSLGPTRRRAARVHRRGGRRGPGATGTARRRSRGGRAGNERLDYGSAVRSAGPARPHHGPRGRTDPLYEFLSSQIVEQLDAQDRWFLTATSLLDEVDAERATALGQEDAAERLRSLRTVHLPATWLATGARLRCHSYFREYLQERLARVEPGHVRELRLAHAHLLAAEGRDEDAVEEFIRARVPEAAVAPAMRAVDGVIDRLDLEIAERWVRVLSPVAPRGASPLVTAELMVALSGENVGEAVRIADRLDEVGERDRLARAAPRVVRPRRGGILTRYGSAMWMRFSSRFRPARSSMPLATRWERYATFRTPVPRTSRLPWSSHDAGTASIYRAGSYARGRLLPLTNRALRLDGGVAAALEDRRAPRALGRTREALGLLEFASGGGDGQRSAPPRAHGS